ncbi:MAG: hydroxymethylglutaryl-CoA reductase, degradative [Saprospiraceae bacterium]|nr:hydroxymethylglutaryl-CoA reductase, degradative [Saprospiraceae bacterium]
MNKIISGFSKLSKAEKLAWLSQHYFSDDDSVSQDFNAFNINDTELQSVFEGFSENTIANFILPFGIAPNFLIDGNVYAIPMAIEESSVVAAASAAAKFWYTRGGFKTTIINTVKVGQVHFLWSGDKELLYQVFPEWKNILIEKTQCITANMQNRGGGILDIYLKDFSHLEPNLYQLTADFDTRDSMGANFINSVLEEFATISESFFESHPMLQGDAHKFDVIMSILSNYTPNSLVRAEVSCKINELGQFCDGELSSEEFAEKFRLAVKVAEIDPYRATTHNKGIFNGIDAVVIATGNDFRAIEACGHTYACRNGTYASLSSCTINDGIFRFWLDMPLAVGTIGGLTRLHTLAKRSLQLLGNPSATQLMSIIVSTGLAQNFAAIKSLITTGIQKGHMKMHLLNILHHFHCTEDEIQKAISYFENKTISFAAVRMYLKEMRGAIA